MLSKGHMGASLYHYTGQVGTRFGDSGSLWSENDVITSWLRLISPSDHFIHPYCLVHRKWPLSCRGHRQFLGRAGTRAKTRRSDDGVCCFAHRSTTVEPSPVSSLSRHSYCRWGRPLRLGSSQRAILICVQSPLSLHLGEAC
jgi:hypothetical protein